LKVVIIYLKGKAWKDGNPHWEQGLLPHRKYLENTLEGKVAVAGPCMDHTSGMVIVEAESVEEVVEIAKNDPAVLEDKFNYEVHPWEVLAGIFN
jgi:uncharacterized protein YciI